VIQPRRISLACLVALAATAGSASADDKADQLFKQGKKLLAEKRYADACKAFEQSYKLDPQIGVELNVAKCYEDWGKVATAYRAYKTAEKLAEDQHDQRVAQIRPRVEKLEADVPKLTVKLPEGADSKGLDLKLDGAPLDVDQIGQPQMVDPGPHLLEYQVGDGDKKSKLVPVERGGDSVVRLDVPKKSKVKDKDKVADQPKPDEHPVKVVKKDKDEEPERPMPDPGKGQRIAAYVVGGVGIVGIAVSSYLALSARNKYRDALASECANATDMCTAQGLTDTHDARRNANIATGVFIGGTAAVIGGIVIYVTAPKASRRRTDESFYLTPRVGPDGVGLVFGGPL